MRTGLPVGPEPCKQWQRPAMAEANVHGRSQCGLTGRTLPVVLHSWLAMRGVSAG